MAGRLGSWEEKSINLSEDLYSQAAQHFVSSAISKYADHLRSVFDAADDAFFDLASNAHSNSEQNRLFEAMRDIRIKRKRIEQQLQELLQSNFKTPQARQNIAQETSLSDSSTWSMVAEENLEEEITLSSMAKRVRQVLGATFTQFEQLVTSGWPALNPEQHFTPIDPELLSKQFLTVAGALEIGAQEKLILIKVFEVDLASALEGILETANAALLRAGIKPATARMEKTLTRQTATSQPDESGKTDKPSQPKQTVTQPAHNSPSSIFTPSFAELRKLLTINQPGRSHTPREHPISPVKLQELLGSMQPPASDNLFDSGIAAPIKLEDAIAHLIQGGETRFSGLSANDEDAIDLVSRLFEFILKDDNISPPIQVLISKLQIPIVRVVLKDPSFFGNHRHPARQLLDTLAKAGTGWNNAEDRQKDKLYAEIHRVVSKVLTEFRDDQSIFVELFLEFSGFLSREEKRTRIVEQRTREAEHGRIKSKNAQTAVENYLNKKLAQYPVPENIRCILTQGWSRFMFLTYLKDSKDNRWSKATEALDTLIWCLQPHASEGEKELWVKKVPPLLKFIKSGLQEVSYNTERLDTMMADLKSALTNAFKTPCTNDLSSVVPTDAVDLVTPQPPTEDEIKLSPFLQQVDNLEIGQWIEFYLNNGSKFRCKLATHIDDGDCYIFVNRVGLKVLEKTRRALGQELADRKLKILSREPLIDRAMEGLVQNLRKISGQRA